MMPILFDNFLDMLRICSFQFKCESVRTLLKVLYTLGCSQNILATERTVSRSVVDSSQSQSSI